MDQSTHRLLASIPAPPIAPTTLVAVATNSNSITDKRGASGMSEMEGEFVWGDEGEGDKGEGGGDKWEGGGYGGQPRQRWVLWGVFFFFFYSNTLTVSPFPFFWIRYCIRLHHFVFVRFVFVCIKGMGYDGMVMRNVNVHSFVWKECNYCTSVCFEWNGDGGCERDFPFFYH